MAEADTMVLPPEVSDNADRVVFVQEARGISMGLVGLFLTVWDWVRVTCAVRRRRVNGPGSEEWLHDVHRDDGAAWGVDLHTLAAYCVPTFLVQTAGVQLGPVVVNTAEVAFGCLAWLSFNVVTDLLLFARGNFPAQVWLRGGAVLESLVTAPSALRPGTLDFDFVLVGSVAACQSTLASVMEFLKTYARVQVMCMAASPVMLTVMLLVPPVVTAGGQLVLLKLQFLLDACPFAWAVTVGHDMGASQVQTDGRRWLGLPTFRFFQDTGCNTLNSPEQADVHRHHKYAVGKHLPTLMLPVIDRILTHKIFKVGNRPQLGYAGVPINVAGFWRGVVACWPDVVV
eukprot:gene2021-2343_t